MSGRTVTLTLTMTHAVSATATVTASYTPPAANPIQDLAGNAFAGLHNRAVRNVSAGVVLSASALTLTEGGSGTYTVRLAARPSADVTVTIARSGDTDVTVDTDAGTAGTQNTLTFTRANWSRARTVTVRAGEDDDTTNDSATLTHAMSGASEYASLADLTVPVTVNDNDVARTTRRSSRPTRRRGASRRTPRRGPPSARR